jgi:hypothetical protein
LAPADRNRIWEFALPRDELYHIHTRILVYHVRAATQPRPPGLPLASKSVRQKTLAYFYSFNTFPLAIGNPKTRDGHPFERSLSLIKRVSGVHGRGFMKLKGLHITPLAGFWKFVPQYLELLTIALEQQMPVGDCEQ